MIETKIIVFGSKENRTAICKHLKSCPYTLQTNYHVQNLVVLIDSDLTSSSYDQSPKQPFIKSQEHI